MIVAKPTEKKERTTLTCKFMIPDPPPGEMLDLDTVHVKCSSMGTEVATFDQVPSAADCAANSFYLDLAVNTIVFCPETCDVVQADDDAEIVSHGRLAEDDADDDPVEQHVRCLVSGDPEHAAREGAETNGGRRSAQRMRRRGDRSAPVRGGRVTGRRADGRLGRL